MDNSRSAWHPPALIPIASELTEGKENHPGEQNFNCRYGPAGDMFANAANTASCTAPAPVLNAYNAGGFGPS